MIYMYNDTIERYIYIIMKKNGDYHLLGSLDKIYSIDYMADIDKNWNHYLTSKRSDIGSKMDRFFKELAT